MAPYTKLKEEGHIWGNVFDKYLNENLIIIDAESGKPKILVETKTSLKISHTNIGDNTEILPIPEKIPPIPGTPINNNNKPTIETYPEADKQEPLPGFTPIAPKDTIKGSPIPDQSFDDYVFYNKISEGNQKTIQDALNSGDNSKISDALGETIDSHIPKEALDKIPSDLKIKQTSKDGIGVRLIDSDKANHDIRIMKGNLNADNPSQKNDYVKIISNGKVIGRDGNVIKDGPNEEQGPGYHPDAHIPKNEWVKWKQWNKP